ncbi:hypothetical protein [Streptosporangium sp. KLBMP 9127]|nr:hypothetical protein [Streptosporangium sp. KLBMP 9127]
MLKKIIAVLCAGALAGTGAALVAAAPAGAAAGIPRGFLLYEKTAGTHDDNDETSWKIDNRRTARLAINPCDRSSLGKAGRTAGRTITYTSVPDFQKIEQVLLYGSAKAAEDTMKQVRAAVRKCAARTSDHSTYRYTAKGTALGDEALRVTGQAYNGKKSAIGGERSVIVRRGNAIIAYTQAGEYGKPAAGDHAMQLKDARKMTAKICSVARCS